MSVPSILGPKGAVAARNVGNALARVRVVASRSRTAMPWAIAGKFCKWTKSAKASCPSQESKRQYTGQDMNNDAVQPLSGDIHQRPPSHDPLACARWWKGLAVHTPPAWLHEEVARRMALRLDWIKLQPLSWLHAQPSVGGWDIHGELVRRYPKAMVFVQEPSSTRLQRSQQQLQASGWQRLNPFRARSHWLSENAQALPVDMIWANMQWHLHPDPIALLQQWHRALNVQGFLMFSFLGPDALVELRQVHQHMDWPEPAAHWTDMHDCGDMLVQTGFAEPVMDMERITLSYSSAERMLVDLRSLGRNLHPNRFKSLRGKGWRQQWLQAVERYWPRRDDKGQLLLTFEIVYGHALRPPDRHRVDSTTRISLDEMKSLLRSA
jgi:malonyl-CoA O-methyltransferase